MRVCVVATSGISLTNFRGRLIQKFIEDGHDVVCISIEPPEEAEADIRELGATYYQVAGSRTGTGILSGFKMIGDYKKAFKEIKPDMCFLYMSKPIAFGGTAAILAKVPEINVLVNGLENAYYRHTFKDFVVRCVMTFFYRLVSRFAKNVFIQNSDDYNFFVKNKISSIEKTCIVNGSGVDMEHFSRKPLPDKPIFLMVARLLWSKGIREYLAAIKTVKKNYLEAHFMLVGGLDSNDEAITKEELDECIANYDIEYCGYASDVRPYIEKASVFVLPSYHEGTPRSALEAMSMGRAVITTTAPGCSDTVEEGINGFKVPVGDSELLADRMIELIKNADKRKMMGEESYRICKEKYEVSLVNRFMINKMWRN